MSKFKFKSLVAVLLIGIAGLTNAADLKHGIVVTESNNPMLEMGVTYFGLTKAEHAQMLVTENKFLNVTEQIAVQAAKLSDKDKNRTAVYAVTLTGQMTDDSGNTTVFPLIFYDKLTLKDINKIMRANNNYASELTSKSEMQAAKGKKAWGNK